MLQPVCPVIEPEHAPHRTPLPRAGALDVEVGIRPDFPQPVDKLRVYVRLGDDDSAPCIILFD